MFNPVRVLNKFVSQLDISYYHTRYWHEHDMQIVEEFEAERTFFLQKSDRLF